MSTAVSTTFTYLRDEYLLAMRRHYSSTLHIRRDVVGGFLGMAGGLALALGTDIGWIAWCLVAAGCLLLALVAYATWVAPALIYATQPKLRNPYWLSFAEDGIRFKTEGIDATLQWSLYHRWRFDDRFYILYHGKRDLTVIPRRALTHDDADNGLRQLLTEHIGKSQP